MNNVGIVVENLDNAIPFFSEIGLTLEGRGTIAGEWGMMVTHDGHSRLEISKFIVPETIVDHRRRLSIRLTTYGMA